MRTRKSDAIVLTLQTGLASLAGMLVVTGGIAHAQTVSESGKASAGDRNMAGEEILVTAQRRQERLIETPVTVSAIGARVIEQLRLNKQTQLRNLVPSLEIAETTAIPSVAIRGIKLNDFGFANESPIALYTRSEERRGGKEGVRTGK